MKNNGLLKKQDVSKYNFDENNIPLKEHPNPYFRRDKYLSLNGLWDFAIVKRGCKPKIFKEKIVVPFTPESPLSGINKLVEPDDVLYYHKIIYLPEDFNEERVIINFLGVDQVCELYINGMFAIKNDSGYKAFSIDIAPLIKKDRKIDILLRVIDYTDTKYFSRGKQCLNRGGIWYTSSSGIYASVYLENAPKDYIKFITYEAYDNGELKGLIETNFEGNILLSCNNQDFVVQANKTFNIKIENISKWDLNNPILYDVSFRFGEDIIHSSTGFRKIELKDVDGVKNLFLNNKKIILKGVLDQGYYYGGNLTPASFESYYNDIKNLKDLGFNTIRKHIKFEMPIFYFYCDKLGILVIQDMINGGSTYNPKLVASVKSVLSKTNDKIDKDYIKFARSDLEGRKAFENELVYMINRFRCVPSIIVYTIFNEGRGQFDSTKYYHFVRKLDINRLIDTTSGWYDNSHSDFLSKHIYFTPIHNFKDKKYHRAFLLSEFGGYSLFLKDHFYGQKRFGYRFYKTRRRLTKAYKHLMDKIINRCLKKNCVGFIYTQLSDIEDELNGLYTFDRDVLKIDKDTIIKINNKIDNLV